jgi:hypothetical protein
MISKRRLRRQLGRLKVDAYIQPHKSKLYRAFLSLPYELLSATTAERWTFLFVEHLPDGRTPAQALDAGDGAAVLGFLRGEGMVTPELVSGAICDGHALEY